VTYPLLLDTSARVLTEVIGKCCPHPIYSRARSEFAHPGLARVIAVVLPITEGEAWVLGNCMSEAIHDSNI